MVAAIVLMALVGLLAAEQKGAQTQTRAPAGSGFESVEFIDGPAEPPGPAE